MDTNDPFRLLNSIVMTFQQRYVRQSTSSSSTERHLDLLPTASLRSRDFRGTEMKGGFAVSQQEVAGRPGGDRSDKSHRPKHKKTARGSQTTTTKPMEHEFPAQCSKTDGRREERTQKAARKSAKLGERNGQKLQRATCPGQLRFSLPASSLTVRLRVGASARDASPSATRTRGGGCNGGRAARVASNRSKSTTRKQLLNSALFFRRQSRPGRCLFPMKNARLLACSASACVRCSLTMYECGSSLKSLKSCFLQFRSV